MSDMIDDNRFVLIEKHKQRLIEGTNIESRPEEMEAAPETPAATCQVMPSKE